MITHEPSSPTYRKLRIEISPSQAKNYGSFKPTDEVFSAWAQTKEIADELEARIIIFQCPASFEPTSENKRNLKKFLSAIASPRYTFVWEPRGWWRTEEIRGLCEELNLIHCVDPFQSKAVFGEIRYYRLHGIAGYRHKYSGEELGKLKAMAQESENSYFLFNNVHMFADAQAFQQLIEATEEDN